MRIFSALYRYMKNGRKVVNPLGLAEQATLMAPHLAACGFEAYLWPPLTMAQGGAAPDADGYGIQYHLNVGQHGQPTRWGFANQVRLACTVQRENGILPMEDLVPAQMVGGNFMRYYELGANGRPDKTLIPKYPTCFNDAKHPLDKVFDPVNARSFGDMIRYESDVIPFYMRDVIVQSALWRQKVFGLGGIRLDMGKTLPPWFMKYLLAKLGGYSFGEVWSGPQDIERWSDAVGGHKGLDFPFYYALRAICDFGQSLRSIPGAGVVALDPNDAVLFAGSADLNLNDDQNIKFNLLWAILLTITRGGDCIVHSQHYLKQEGCYGLRDQIDNIMWYAATFCIGGTTWEYVEDDVLIWSRNGDGGKYGWSGGALMGFSRDSINTRTVRTTTPYQPGDVLHDYSGHADDVTVNWDRTVLLRLPPNQNGTARNYVLYAKRDVNRALPIRPLPAPILTSPFDFSNITVKYPQGAPQ